MYAFGMVVYEVVTGARPFGQRRAAELLIPTIEGTRPNRPENPVAVGFGQGTWEFLVKCWDGDRGRRPTVGEALEHFGCVAKTSRVVGPGPTIPGYGTAGGAPSRLESSSIHYCEIYRLLTVSPSDSTISQIDRPPLHTQLEQIPTNGSYRTCTGYESESSYSVPSGRGIQPARSHTPRHQITPPHASSGCIPTRWKLSPLYLCIRYIPAYFLVG